MKLKTRVDYVAHTRIQELKAESVGNPQGKRSLGTSRLT